MTQAFYTGLSGLKSNQQAIDVISDNLANVSTIGFRAYYSEFSNIFEEGINTDSGGSSLNNTVGIGSKLNDIVMDESQGVFQLTPSSTDLAILGDGWFGIEAGKTDYYTRDGSFTFDSNRDLVTQDGLFVLGTMGDNTTDGVLTKQLHSIPLGEVEKQERLSFPKELHFPPIATTEATFSGNLPLAENVVSVSAPIINSSGIQNSLRLEFTKSEPQVSPGVQWDVVSTTQTRDGETIYDTQSGVVAFSENGALLSNTLGSISNEGSPISLNLGTDFNGIISIDAPSSLTSSSDGLQDGELVGYDININGEVIATFTNGQQSNVGTVAVFHFANDRGLDRITGAKFVQSNNSGKAFFEKDKDGNNITGSSLTNNKLEGSNVRLEAGLTDLIIYQRSYDANSKSITTADQMLQKALSMDA